jgi:hypothetical protein
MVRHDAFASSSSIVTRDVLIVFRMAYRVKDLARRGRLLRLLAPTGHEA